MRRGDAYARADQAVQGIHLGVLPFRFLHLAAVPTALSHRASIAATAGLAAFLVLGQLVKAPLLRFLVDLGAAQLPAAGDDVYRRFLAALEAAYHRVDHAVINQRLQALGDF